MSSFSTSDSPNPQNPDRKTLDNKNPGPKPPDNQNPEILNPSGNEDEKGRIIQEERENDGEEEEEEEEGECGFCLFMKGGGCRDQFIAWENCIEAAEKNKEDIVDKCFEVTSNLKKCMEAHSDYYEPILRAEKAAEEELKQELEKKNDEQNEIEIGKEG